MAYSNADIGADEVARAALDKPLLAIQALPVSPTVVRWTEVGATTSTDRSLLGTNPPWRAYDGYPHYITKPDSTASNVWYLVFDFGAGNEIEFDCAFIIGHNFGTIGGLDDIPIEVDDSGAFGTALEIGNFAAGGAPTDDTRIALLTLKDDGSVAERWSNVRYVRLKISNSGGGNFTPEVSEFILGRRRQLEYKPTRPFDDVSLHHQSARAETEGGVKHITRYNSNKFLLDGTFKTDTAAYASDLEEFLKTVRGTFVWVYDPNSSPNAWHFMMFEEDDLPMPLTGPTVRDVELQADEQGPESFHLAEES